MEFFDFEGLDRVGEFDVDYAVDTLAPEFEVLPDRVFIELGAEVNSSTIFKNVQVNTCIKHSMQFSQPLLRISFDFLNHCITHITQSVETIGLHLPRLIKRS